MPDDCIVDYGSLLKKAIVGWVGFITVAILYTMMTWLK